MYLLLVFFSGFAGLVYEVLWMKQLGLLFGSTSQAAGVTLAAFFAGMAVGSWAWGRRVAKRANPLRAYAALEGAIAVSACLYFLVLWLFHSIYPPLYQAIESDALLLAVKFVLALVLVFPPALFMGGTVPVLGQFLVRKPAEFGKKAAVLYAVNTLGATLGAFFGGFFFPLWFGFRLTCAGAILLNIAVAAVAFRLSRTAPGTNVGEESNGAPARGSRGRGKRRGKQAEATAADVSAAPRRGERWAVLLVGFLSGFGFLALEVVWTRMFAQVLENSVYTFAAILVIVLFCLAVGAFLSSLLARRVADPLPWLAGLLLAGGLAAAIMPFLFMKLTDSLQILALRDTWPNYVALIFRKGFLALGLPGLLLGMVFPFLMKAEERQMVAPGISLGRLAGLNTVGAIVGSLACGFVFLDVFGMWRTTQLLAAAYLIVAVLLPLGRNARGWGLRGAGVALLALAFTVLDPADLPITSTDPDRRADETILETWEGSYGTVAVARGQQGLTIKMNSHYGLGATRAARQEQLQNEIPLMIYPRTESIFFLGLGTGITAGDALDPQFEHVKRIVACELVPEVIAAAKKYITDVDGRDFTNGLFNDPRATVLVEDGRHFVMASGQTFDMVNGDLFVPFRSGVGNLYSLEHFRNVKERLEPGGVFVQWLPLYQMTENEVFIMARTMLEAFPQVSLWRSNFQPGDEVVAFVGHKDGGPVPACDLDSATDKRVSVAGATFRDLGRLALPFNQQTVLFFYCGNVTESADLFEDYPVNTDDHPVIEYLAPRTYRKQADAAIPWFVGPRLARLVEALQQRCPPDEDPLLRNRTEANRRLPTAGMYYHRARLWQVMGDPQRCRIAWHRFLEQWLDE